MSFSTRLSRWNGDDRPALPKGDVVKFKIHRAIGDGTVRTYNIRYRRLRPPKRARDIPHNYSVSRGLQTDFWCSGRTGYGPLAFQHNTLGPTWVSAFCDPLIHPGGSNYQQTLFDNNDQIRLVGKLREQIFGSDFNASVFLGESHQTLRLIGDSATRIYQSLRHLRRGNIRKAADFLVAGTPRRKRLNNRSLPTAAPTDDVSLSRFWLEIQYGWRPLLSDAYSAAQALAKAVEVPFQMRYSVSIRKEKSSVILKGVNCGAHAHTWSYQLNTLCRRGLTVYITEKPSLAAQLGVLNPENVAWELIPFSFVVDWFIPIGSFLDARAVVSCVTGLYVTADKIESRLNNVKDTGDDPSVGRTFYEDISVYKTLYQTFTRTVGPAPALPLPSFKSIGKAASWQHCANAVALLTSSRVR